MPRKPRLHVPGGLYHVVLRGNNRQALFFSVADRLRLQQLVAKSCRQPGPGEFTATTIQIINNRECDLSKSAAHEFGHELGFADAYDLNTLQHLHSDGEDIMTNTGAKVKGYHGKILHEKCGN